MSTEKEFLKRDPGKQLRDVRERLQLRYRDVEQASHEIARTHRNRDFVIGLSRLADMENKGTVPSIFRLYSLCAIYKLNIATVLNWYGVGLTHLARDAAGVALEETHLFDIAQTGPVNTADPQDNVAEPTDTSILGTLPCQAEWIPLAFAYPLEARRPRFGVIGSEDWSMYPVLFPGSLVRIDAGKRRITSGGWAHERERPIYFLSHRKGYACGWCSEECGTVTLLSHPASDIKPRLFTAASGVEVIGQVVGVTMHLDQVRRHHTHS